MKPNRLLIATIALLLSAACSNDSAGSINGAAKGTADTTSGSASSGASKATESPADRADAERFCTITTRLEAAGQEAFAGLGRNASPAEYKAAERAFVLDNAAMLDQLVVAAPATLAPHVETMLTAMRQRGGLADGHVEQQEAANAEKHILAFEKSHC